MIEKYFHEYIFRDFEEKIEFSYYPFKEDMGCWETFNQSLNTTEFFDALKKKLKESEYQEKYMSDLMKELQQEAYEAKNIINQSEAVIKFINSWKPKSPNPNAKVNPKKKKKKVHFNPDDVSEISFVKKEAKEEKKRKLNRWG